MEGSERGDRATGGGEQSAAGSDLGGGGVPETEGEFDLIRGFLRGVTGSRAPDVRVGAGDDCAVVAGDGIVLGTDLSIEDVHFRREWLRAEEIGYRATCAALSDLAAMAARPIGVLASLAVAPGDAGPFARDLMRGVRDAIERFGGVLLGGDLTRSPGPLILDVIGVGEAPVPVLRRGALPGDELWITGALGGAAAAVAAWASGGAPDPRARVAFAAPVPRIPEAHWLAAHGIPRAMLDLSDGLAGDAGHLAAAGGVAVVLESTEIPLHPAARSRGGAPLSLALGGGEDYELCFAARPGYVDAHLAGFREAFDLSLTRVGRFEAGEGVHLATPGGGRKSLSTMGFQHFGATG